MAKAKAPDFAADSYQMKIEKMKISLYDKLILENCFWNLFSEFNIIF